MVQKLNSKTNILGYIAPLLKEFGLLIQELKEINDETVAFTNIQKQFFDHNLHYLTECKRLCESVFSANNGEELKLDYNQIVGQVAMVQLLAKEMQIAHKYAELNEVLLNILYELDHYKYIDRIYCTSLEQREKARIERSKLLSKQILELRSILKTENVNQFYREKLLFQITEIRANIISIFFMDQNVLQISDIYSSVKFKYLKILNHELETKLSTEKLSDKEQDKIKTSLNQAKLDLKEAEVLLNQGKYYDFNQLSDEIIQTGKSIVQKMINKPIDQSDYSELVKFYSHVYKLINLIKFKSIIWEEENMSAILSKIFEILKLLDRILFDPLSHTILYYEFLRLNIYMLNIVLTEHILTEDLRLAYNKQLVEATSLLEKIQMDLTELEKQGYKDPFSISDEK